MIAGEFGGRRLDFIPTQELRPTSDRARETLFNWLAPILAGTRALDLFAGSGALGLEALSRGAKQVIFVEQAKKVSQKLEQNLQLLNAQERGQVFTGDALRWLKNAPTEPFGLVFLDPPYPKAHLAQDALRLLCERELLTHNSWVYLEQPSQVERLAFAENWILQREKVMGQILMRLYRR